MIPGARIASAIGILDDILAGASAEKTLTTWARKNRYAGSGDRAAIRDLVFDALRCQRSFGWLGGADDGAATGRQLMLGSVQASGGDVAAMFSGEGYGAAALTEDEAVSPNLAAAPQAVALDMPDWLMPALRDSLGDDLTAVCTALRHRAPVFLRVNTARTTRDAVAQQLAAEGIDTAPHDLAPTALQVQSNPRRVQNSAAYKDGLVELQDAASQAVVDRLPTGARVLDYCAGGGGKSLALAARRATQVFAHDADEVRMRDLPQRAARAGVRIETVATEALAGLAPFDLVLCDAPCSGSGSWRRSPQGKWQLTQERLDELGRIQSGILDDASRLVAPGGTLAYVTCSMLRSENEDIVNGFLARQPMWRQAYVHRFSVLNGGDGFFVSHLTHEKIHA